MTPSSPEQVPGQFTLVLHTHLPWLAHHGRWPVGEEWLYQSWSAAYLPLMRVLRSLAAEGRRGLVTLGITPVVAAQLDDPYCLDGMHRWLANWQLRAMELATDRDPVRAEAGRAHFRDASAALVEDEAGLLGQEAREGGVLGVGELVLAGDDGAHVTPPPRRRGGRPPRRWPARCAAAAARGRRRRGRRRRRASPTPRW